jgi:DNA-binding NarL/FixJ family response regulator
MKNGRPKGSARPGVRFHPLTELEKGTLQALGEGMTIREIAEAKMLNPRVVWRRIHQLRLKLGAFTTYELMVKATKEGIIQ